MKNIKSENRMGAGKIIFHVNIVVLFTLLIATNACKSKFYETPAPGVPTAGTADFTKYVAVGSTISAGFADQALYNNPNQNEGQEVAYPNLIAKKIQEYNQALVFNQPLIPSINGWSGTAAKGKLVFVKPACSTVTISGVAQAGESSVLSYSGDKSLLTNLSVPFITIDKINTAVPAGTAYNNPRPYYNNIVTGTLGIASEAKKRQGTFFTVWLGYVDALAYATKGGTTALVTPAAFQQNISDLLDSLLAAPGSKGVIANVPYVDLFPVITNGNRRLTSTNDPARNPLRLTATEASTYNAALGSNIFSGAPANRNFYAIKTGTGSIRQLNTSKDFIVRGALLDSIGKGPIDTLNIRFCTTNATGPAGQRTLKGLQSAVASADVLDKDEITYLRSIIDQYNQAIQAEVNKRNANGIRVGLVDLNSFFTTLSDPLFGIRVGTEVLRTNHPAAGPDFGGFFSLDRYTPTPKGQAALANEFIKIINTTFGSTLNQYSGADIDSKFRNNTIPGLN